ncbi:MAG: amidohydrolase [Acholeplasma sp.]|jgi:predicted amidohydrolase YtcJ|nr:MAG: amidohydrolase [Acholeplasma sp.]
MKKWIHGNFHTMIREDEVFHTMLTDNGVILGFDDEIQHIPCDEIIDLHDHHVYPGFVDAHLHLLGYGRFITLIDLRNVYSKDRVFKALLENRHKDMLYAEGYRDLGITKQDLDAVIADKPVFLRHLDYHSLTLNSSALKIVGLSNSNGILREEEAMRVLQQLPKHTKEELKVMLKHAFKQLHAYGVTGGDSDDLYYFNGFAETFSVFDEVLKEIPFRTHLLMHHETITDYLSSGKSWNEQTPFLELGAVKMFYDGTMSSKTALMRDSYRGTDQYGEIVMGKEKFVETLKRTRTLGLTAAIHVIGDQGLDDVAHLLKSYPPKPGQKDRIIHAPWAMKSTIPLLKKLPITIDIQPQFLSSDLPRALSYFSKNPDLIFPWKTYLDEGILILGSSDAPVETPNPLFGMRDAIYRESTEDKKSYQIEEALTPFEAVKLYTTYAHHQHVNKNRGYLAKGMLADLSMTSHNLFTLKKEQWDEKLIEMTVIDERIVYKR